MRVSELHQPLTDLFLFHPSFDEKELVKAVLLRHLGYMDDKRTLRHRQQYTADPLTRATSYFPPNFLAPVRNAESNAAADEELIKSARAANQMCTWLDGDSH